MGYSSALTAAGAQVLAFEKFGDYQGSWGAVCDYNNERVLVVGSYGSCSSCDAFEGEFGYRECEVWNDETGEYEYDPQLQAAYDTRLAHFGESYLKNPYTEQMVKFKVDKLNQTSEDDWFDHETLMLYEWALSHF